jgi:hypothetical protein
VTGCSPGRSRRRLAAEEERLLLDALGAFGGGRPGVVAIVLVVCSFARNEVLYGTRGYRRTLLEAGQVIRRLAAAAAAAGLTTDVVYDYADYDVDAALGVDGVEEGSVAAIFVEGDGDR